MTWLITLATGALAALLGGVALGFLADRWTVWFRVSNFEGAAGYYVIFNALFGAVASFFIGIACSRYVVQGAEANFLRGLLLTGGWIAGIWTVLAGVSYAIADHPPRLEGKALVLDIEIRTPPQNPLLDRSDLRPMISIENASGSSTSYGTVPSDQTRAEGNRWIIPLTLPLRSSSAHRTARIRWSDDLSFAADLPLPAHPNRKHFEWTGWVPPRDPSTKGDWAAPGTDLGFEVRFRVGFQQPPPPLPPAEEVAKQREEATSAQLQALPANAPLPDFLPFTRHGISEANQQVALERLRSREGFDAEFAARVVDDNAELAAEVLRLVPRLPGPEKPLLEPVAAAGRDLLIRLNRTLEISAEADPGYEAAAAISIRFSGWMAAVFHLRDRAQGDFTPELKAVLLAARKRPDSEALRRDVVRVASYYLHQWTGEAPLPTDPPPR